MNLRRKRLRLMRDTQWRGYLRTAEGNPVTLSHVRSMANLSVFGNSSQDGTPSPDNPVEVVGSGEKTGNLFDLTDVLNSDGYIDSNYNKSIAITPFHVVNGQKYILITKGNQLNNDQYASVYFGESDLKYPTGNTKIMGTDLLYYAFENNVEKRYIMTATKTCDITHCMIHGKDLYNSAYNVEKFGVYEYNDDYDTMPYDPYGYKVPVQASGQNLFNAVDFAAQDGIITNSDGSFTMPTNTTFQYDIEVHENTEYTLSAICNTDNVYAGLFLSFYNRNMEKVGQVYFWMNTSLYNLKIEDAKYIRISGAWTNRYTITFKDFMIVEGSYNSDTMPTYEQYKEPQSFNIYTPQILHGVGNAHDCVVIDFDNKTAKLCKKTNVKQYPSTVKNREIRGDYCLYYLDTDTDKKQMIQCKCNLFESTYAMTGDINSVFLSQYDAHPTLLISIEKNIIGYDDTTDDINSGRIKLDNWLLQKQMEGTPLTVTYALADDYITTTDITALQQWDSLPNLKGTWILTANGGTEPTLRAEYYSEERSTSIE